MKVMVRKWGIDIMLKRTYVVLRWNSTSAYTKKLALYISPNATPWHQEAKFLFGKRSMY